MDEDGTGDCADWELVQKEEMTGTVNESRSCVNTTDLPGVGVNPVRILPTDCLAPRSSKGDWIDPMGEPSVELSGDRYDDDKSVDLDVSNELDLDENDDLDALNELDLDENDDASTEVSSDESDNDNVSTEVNVDETESVSTEVIFYEIDNALIELNFDEIDNASIELNLDVNYDLDVSNELNMGIVNENDEEIDGFDGIETVIVKSEDSDEIELAEMKSGESEIGEDVHAIVEAVKPTPEDEKRKSILWWKAPINFFKCCAFRFKHVWTLSVIAAFIGFVIFQRRCRKLKNKNAGLKLKLTMDENKETRLINHVARMNEAFSVARRIPVARPSLQATDVIVTWSRMGSG